MRDYEERPLTALEIERIEQAKRAAKRRRVVDLKRMRAMHALSARGEASPLTLIEQVRELPEEP